MVSKEVEAGFVVGEAVNWSSVATAGTGSAADARSHGGLAAECCSAID